MSLSQARWLQPDFPFRPSKCPLFYGWVIVGASVMGMMSSIPGQTAGVGPFTDHLLENLQLSRLELSAAYLVGTALSGFILPKMGSLFDAYGARLTGTVVKVAFGLSLCYMASTAWLYRMFKPSEAPLPWLALGLVTAGFFLIRFLGQGVTAMISRAMLGKWFNRKRGIASAIGGCATSLAFSGGPLVLFALVEVIGWREAWLALGLLLIGVVSVLTWLTYRDNPEECGLEMDGDPALQKAAETTDPEFVVHREYTGPEAIRTYSF
ncbi:MAG: MFS transporter, partial [Verrucomicrobiota bacterium]